MNTKITITILSLLILAGAGAIYYLKKGTIPKGQSYRIAIFEPASHPAMDEIAQGFIDEIKRKVKKPITFDRYNANGDKTLLRSQAEEIVQGNYDLIIPIGAGATRTVHELTTKKSLTTPIVFTAVSKPVELGVVASLKSSNNNVTGVEDEQDYHEEIEQLISIKPSTKHVLVVYDPGVKEGTNEKDYKKVKLLLEQKKIAVAAAQVYHANEIQTRVQPLLENIDVVMALTDNTVVSGIDTLVTLCNRYGITLLASDLNSGDRGAALSFGPLQYDYGVAAATLAAPILNENSKPTDIPITRMHDDKLKVNTKTMERQGLKLSADELEKIKNAGGIVI